ncbi:aminopeptidase P family protein [Mycoplasma sp. T363T]|uniref:Aminopeptidase P family protein n=1 Tax=Mycoplasma bradburyae TaxID=2963128 RepID=A0AAW6HSI6_9MOLU|nr:aminopeptidase P family protein [Mycoplasma bradburyae]MDC4163413.1 aminopeptidase P family protein [Mycoplasma bradburyae]MDC4182029.1 aminopeptidase P family protein [Mycoplasma bradburyae]MDC4183400.1 aminopeptidase P family protein [Mycoplasma bradburyae]UTS70454.1 aminopeptidase P family protein [Mycoplasma bradburyae]
MLLEDFQFKHDIIKKELDKHNADGILLASDQNRLWFTEFNSSAGFLLVTKSNSVLIIDSRYFEAATKSIKNTEVVLMTANALTDVAKKLNIKHLLIEADYLTYQYQGLLDRISEKQTAIDTQSLRAIKTPSELEKLIKVIDITKEVGNKLPEMIKLGMTEMQLAKLVTFALIEAGGEKNSFDPIVASGPNGSKPHHKPTNRKFEDGDFITVDFGTIYQGFCSDITRTWVLNKPKNQRLINAYKLVDQSNLAGIEAARADLTGKEVDKVCRDLVDESEFKGMFVHSTGHGVGIDIHEKPNVSSAFNEKLGVDSIVTIEPGIYIPDVGGIRIEDMIQVKETNSIWLSKDIARMKL